MNKEDEELNLMFRDYTEADHGEGYCINFSASFPKAPFDDDFVLEEKDAIRYILYNKANSNCVQGINPGTKIWYDLSPWRVGLYVAWGVGGAIDAGLLVYMGLIMAGKVTVKEKEIDPNADEY